MLDSLSELIRARRSLKPADMDAERSVPENLLLRLLENGTWAPTHGLTEPWRFHVFSGPTRARLAAAMQEIYPRVTPPEAFRADKLDKLGRNPVLAPVVVACCVEKRGGDKIPFLEEVEAVACALQNIMLSATATGLGSFWSSPPLLGTRAFGEWLGLGADDLCIGLLYLGWPRTGRTPPMVSRRPLAEKVTFHHDA